LDQSPKCPKCGSEMEKRLGKFGYFWGCTKFKKNSCQGTIDILKEPLMLEYIDYDNFVQDNPLGFLYNLIEKENMPKYIKELHETIGEDGIIKGTILREDVKGKISGILDYLRKKKMYFTMSKILYWFYKIEGDLQTKTDFFLNQKPDGEFRDERFVKEAVYNYWHLTPFSFLGFECPILEYPIRGADGEDGGYIIDIFAQDIIAEESVLLVEVKGVKRKAKDAWGQIYKYVKAYEYMNNKNAKGYIVSLGYPRGIFDKSFGLVGYVIEGNKMSLIPWNII